MTRRLACPAWALVAALSCSMIATLALPCGAQASASGAAAGSASKPVVLGWAELDADGLDIQYRNAAVLVPRQLIDRLAFVLARYPSAEEFDMAISRESGAALQAARKAVADARSKRDLAAIATRDPDKRAADIVTAEAAIRRAEGALASAIEAAGSRPAAVSGLSGSDLGALGSSVGVTPWTEHASGALLPVATDPAAACATAKIDLLVHGRLRPKGDYIGIELSLFVAALGRDVWTASDYAFADGLEEAVSALSRPLAEAILGKPYARVFFRISPVDADLFLDGEAFAGGSALYFERGDHEARAKARGHDQAANAFEVVPGEDLVVDMSLAERPAVGFALRSEPPGASVYLDGVRSGFAPLDVAGADYPRVARLSMPGYDDAQLVLRPESLLEDPLVGLKPADGRSFDERFDDGKGSFYRALGLFISSLPVVVLSGGLFQTYNAALSALADEDSGGLDAAVVNRLNSGFYAAQAVFWASASVSAGLLARAGFKLAAYLCVSP